LTAGDAVIGHQHGFNLADLRGRFPKPRQNRVFLVAGRARHATDAIAFGQLGKGFHDFTRWRLSPIKQGSFSGCERASTGATLIALLSVVCATKLDDIPLRCGLWLPVISAVRIGTEIARLD
jgi:hypothetical protein